MLEDDLAGLDLGEIEDFVDEVEEGVAALAELFVSTCSRCSRVRSESRRRLVMPRTPFMGVRISWLTLARNSSLARFAASAASLASRSASWCASDHRCRCTTRTTW